MFLGPKAHQAMDAKLRSRLDAGCRMVSYLFSMGPQFESYLREVHDIRKDGTRIPAGGPQEGVYARIYVYAREPA